MGAKVSKIPTQQELQAVQRAAQKQLEQEKIKETKTLAASLAISVVSAEDCESHAKLQEGRIIRVRLLAAQDQLLFVNVGYDDNDFNWTARVFMNQGGKEKTKGKTESWKPMTLFQSCANIQALACAPPQWTWCW